MARYYQIASVLYDMTVTPNFEESEDEKSEDEESEDDKDVAPEGGADSQPHLDQASSKEPRVRVPTATEDDQAETRQPTTPPAGAADSTNLPDPPAAPLA